MNTGQLCFQTDTPGNSEAGGLFSDKQSFIKSDDAQICAGLTGTACLNLVQYEVIQLWSFE